MEAGEPYEVAHLQLATGCDELGGGDLEPLLCKCVKAELALMDTVKMAAAKENAATESR